MLLKQWQGQGGEVSNELAQRLRGHVERLAYPRHYERQAAANRKARDDIKAHFIEWGYEVHYQGSYDNIIALPPEHDPRLTLVCAHYDSVPSTPGADDNASALAVMLETAYQLRPKRAQPLKHVGFVSFNREEDGLLGSREFVRWLVEKEPFALEVAHVLEMVGFATEEPHSQQNPIPFLPAPHIGNFLGLLSNKHSMKAMDRVFAIAKEADVSPPLVGLRSLFGLEQQFTRILDSDHTPFWLAGQSSILWTDTANFRNPHYHLASDTPETLNYDFMARITGLLVESVRRPLKRKRWGFLRGWQKQEESRKGAV